MGHPTVWAICRYPSNIVQIYIPFVLPFIFPFSGLILSFRQLIVYFTVFRLQVLGDTTSCDGKQVPTRS